MTAPTELTRPIIGIENRTAQEVFDIMCDRTRSALVSAPAVPDAVRAEAEELLRNATYEDGQATVLTQDCEALEAALAASPAPVPDTVEGVGLYGPFGWLNGCRGLSEDSWSLETDPLENSEESFAIPLYATVDPFEEIGVAVNGDASAVPALPDAMRARLAMARGHLSNIEAHGNAEANAVLVIRNVLAELEAALAASHMPVGDGYVLVPKEPTEHILREMAGAARDFLTETGMYPRSKMVYRVMLAAARAGEDG